MRTIQIRLLILLAIFGIAAQTNAGRRLGIKGEEQTSIGIIIQNISSGDILYDYNSDIALTPASIMKCVTTASALSLLGDDYRFSTGVELRGVLADSVLAGDLVICSSGDPTLESSQFKENSGFAQEILAKLRQLGLRRIEGDIRIEENMSEAGAVPQWEIEDVPYTYGAGLFGLNYRDNSFKLNPVTRETQPYVPDLEVELRKGPGNDLIRGVDSNKLIVCRTDTTTRNITIWGSMPDPAAVLRAELLNLLDDSGIEVMCRKIERSDADKVYTLMTKQSLPSAEIMRSLMVRSDNLFAEGMLRAIAPGQSRSEAIKREKALWQSRGLEAGYTIIRDGSGLARANKVSPRFMAGVLRYMAKSDMSEVYSGFFPRVGKEGTVKSFLAKTPLAGQLALKTGSVNAVQCYAGYKLDSQNRPTHVIVVMINGFFCERSSVKSAIEKMLLNTKWK